MRSNLPVAMYLLALLVLPHLAIGQTAPPTRGWAAVPSVIRADGIDQFRLEVHLEQNARRVYLRPESDAILGPAGQGMTIELLDDGSGADKIANDRVYTAGPFRYNPAAPPPVSYLNDPASPAGLDWAAIGQVTIEEAGGGTATFLDNLHVGVLDPRLPATAHSKVGAQALRTSHVLNIDSGEALGQRYLRGDWSVLGQLTQRVFDQIPDQFDFLFVLSTEKREHSSRLAKDNYRAGAHEGIRVPFTGTGIPTYDRSATFHTSGTLQAVNVLDIGPRGLNSANAVHELLHHWGSHAGAGLGFNLDSAHYSSQSNAGSLVGGFAWTEQPGGGWIVNCEQGAMGASQASPLDLYFMGLIDASQAPAIRVYKENVADPKQKCGVRSPLRAEDVELTLPLDQLERTVGARLPGPGQAQKDFRLLFVVETRGRLLTEAEATFYDTLAAWFTRPLEGKGVPKLHYNWASIAGFFGHGTMWSSETGLADPETIAFVESLCAKTVGAGCDVQTLARQITEGTQTRASAASALVQHPRYLAAAIAILRSYQATYGRLPDQQVFSYWMEQTRGGLPVNQVLPRLLDQPEFRLLNAMKANAAFARELYRNLYGSAAPAAVLDRWVRALESGYSRLDLVQSAVLDPLYIQASAPRITAAAALFALSPQPSPARIEEWAVALTRFTPLEQLIGALFYRSSR